MAIRKQKLILISYYKKNHPKKKKLLLKKKESQQYTKVKNNRATNLEIEAETIVTSIFWPRICLLCILPVLTPRFAASD